MQALDSMAQIPQSQIDGLVRSWPSIAGAKRRWLAQLDRLFGPLIQTLQASLRAGGKLLLFSNARGANASTIDLRSWSTVTDGSDGR